MDTTPIPSSLPAVDHVKRFALDHWVIVLSTLFVGMALIGWNVSLVRRVTVIEVLTTEQATNLEKRIANLEAGRSMPMSPQMRTEIDGLRRDFDKMEAYVKAELTKYRKENPTK